MSAENVVKVATIEQALLRRRAFVAADWDGQDAIVLGAGRRISRPGWDDLTYPFEAHPESTP